MQDETAAPAEPVRVAFDAAAATYDRTRRQLIPCFDDFYRTAVARVAGAVGDAPRILDLGAGTGLLSAFVAAAVPRADLTLVDVSSAMLAQARGRLAHETRAGRVRFEAMDYAVADLRGSFDAVVSALSIHHLDAPAKRRLFARIHTALRPGGVFVNADQVKAETEPLERRNTEAWLAEVRARGIPADVLAAARERMTLDRTDTLADQLAWLRAAGFGDAQCCFLHGFFAVFGGRRDQ